MQSWNSAQQQRLTEPILEADWYGPCLASGALQPEVLAPGLGEVLLHTCDTVKTQNVFTSLFIEKDFNLTLCLWMSLREMRWSCTTSATSWVQFGSMGIDQPWKTQPQPLCLQDLPGNQVNCRALFEDAVFNTHSKVFCDCGYFFCVLYLFKNVLLVSSW